MSRNSKNAKRIATAREQNREKGFKGPSATTPKHEKKLANRSKYNTKFRIDPKKGRQKQTEEGAANA